MSPCHQIIKYYAICVVTDRFICHLQHHHHQLLQKPTLLIYQFFMLLLFLSVFSFFLCCCNFHSWKNKFLLFMLFFLFSVEWYIFRVFLCIHFSTNIHHTPPSLLLLIILLSYSPIFFVELLKTSLPPHSRCLIHHTDFSVCVSTDKEKRK